MQPKIPQCLLQGASPQNSSEPERCWTQDPSHTLCILIHITFYSVEMCRRSQHMINHITKNMCIVVYQTCSHKKAKVHHFQKSAKFPFQTHPLNRQATWIIWKSFSAWSQWKLMALVDTNSLQHGRSRASGKEAINRWFCRGPLGRYWMYRFQLVLFRK